MITPYKYAVTFPQGDALTERRSILA